jgi:hypothetical protein
MVDHFGSEDEHIYLSTGCLHGVHGYCQSPKRFDGEDKLPSSCKFCGAPCICPCHEASLNG